MAKKIPEVDPLSFLAIRYEDLRKPVLSRDFNQGVKVLAAGRIVAMDIKTGPKANPLMVATLRDEAGLFYVKFFRFTKFHETIFGYTNKRVYLWGAPKKEDDRNRWCFYHPEFPKEIGRILPVYRCPKGIGQGRMRNHVWHATRKLMEAMKDGTSPDVPERETLLPMAEALRQIHHPTDRIPDESVLQRIASGRCISSK
jgi:RecG-like helicase